MFQERAIRIFIFSIITCLLAASLNVQVWPVYADDIDATYTPTVTETIELPPTIDIIETATDTPSPTQETEPAGIESASQTPTPTFTFTPAPIIQGSYISDEVLVRFKISASKEATSTCLRRVNGHIDSAIEELRVTVIKLDSVSVSNAVATLSACEGVRYVEPNYLVFSADRIPSDAGWGNQYGLVNIRAPQAWGYTTGSSNIVIAVIDSGVDLSHPDLASKIVAGYDFVNNDTTPQDDNGHGTHVAGIAAAVSNNGSGVAGVSWGARIMPVKVLNASGSGTFANVASGIIWATDHGAHVINLSLGGVPSSIVLEDAINYASGNGVLVIGAVGNTGGNLIFYPAAYPNVIAVGSTDSLNNRAGFSNYGSQIDLVAPGVSIYSTSIGSTYSFKDGTSMSTPFVSGFAALLLGIPGNGSGSVRALMESTALDLGAAGWDGFYGNGLIQMDTAIQMIWPTPTGVQENNSPPLLFNGFQFTPTFTYTPSPTIFPTFTASTTPTLETINANGISSNTPTAEIIALSTELPEKNSFGRGWIMPCSAIFLILMGLLLFWISSRRRKKRFSY